MLKTCSAQHTSLLCFTILNTEFLYEPFHLLLLFYQLGCFGLVWFCLVLVWFGLGVFCCCCFKGVVFSTVVALLCCYLSRNWREQETNPFACGNTLDKCFCLYLHRQYFLLFHLKIRWEEVEDVQRATALCQALIAFTSFQETKIFQTWNFTGKQSGFEPVIPVSRFILFLSWLRSDKEVTILIIRSNQGLKDDFSVAFQPSRAIYTQDSKHKFFTQVCASSSSGVIKYWRVFFYIVHF